MKKLTINSGANRLALSFLGFIAALVIIALMTAWSAFAQQSVVRDANRDNCIAVDEEIDFAESLNYTIVHIGNEEEIEWYADKFRELNPGTAINISSIVFVRVLDGTLYMLHFSTEEDVGFSSRGCLHPFTPQVHDWVVNSFKAKTMDRVDDL